MNRNLIEQLPLLPLRGALVFPFTVVPFNVGRRKSLNAIDQAMSRNRLIVLASQKDVKVDEPKSSDLYEMGTVAVIKQVNRTSEQTVKIIVEGKSRCRILEYIREEPYFEVLCEEIPEIEEKSQETEALVKAVVQQYEEYVRMSKRVPPEALISIANVGEPGRLADTIASYMVIGLEDKQKILEAVAPKERLQRVSNLLSREMEVLELEKRINMRVRKQLEKTQREYFLREQMKAIQKELGEKDEKSEAEEYRAKVQEAGLPEEVKAKALKEIERLEKMPPAAAEAVVVRTYLDWLIELPWVKETEDCNDITKAEQVLEDDHYGLKHVKERILEYMAVRQLSGGMRSPILCFVGPPGVGKTSLARSVARALGRKFVRVSLGGIRDEAEIRGHRRTYVGALPGRIIQGIKQAGSKNPVFLLDEIDKLGVDFRGDPSSALLEALDPEQNSHFSDHYIEIAFDLSKVLFITTANTTQTIPRALLDRLEVVQIPGYTEEEKVQIAKRHLIPKQFKEHGIKRDQLSISPGVIQSIIRCYTREAGVRNLEREIAKICRKAAKSIVRGEKARTTVTTLNIHKFLGPPRFRYGVAEKQDEIGVAMGVGWTETGGDVMPIEVTVVRGKGNLLLTGKLGEVMKESAQAALSYVRSRASQFGIEEGFHEKYDIHVHVLEGATPKEGPSAGITIAVAMVSALTRRAVRRDVAMTGEITLRGKVLPIGGVKEKVLAAHRAGIKCMILPKENDKDLKEIPQAVLRKMEFVLVEHMDEVLKTALIQEAEQLSPAVPVPFDEHFTAWTSDHPAANM